MNELLTQAQKVIAALGHKAGCAFAGCTCGQVEELKVELSEYYRILQRMK